MPTLPLLIEQQTDLNTACERIAEHAEIALDTEFVRTNTYAPHLGLLQIAAGDTVVCIDPLADMDLSNLWELLFDPARTCLIHSGSQDMEVLWYTCGQVIPNLIDTQICAAMLGYPAQIGYAGLAKELVNADISKTQTRTDWSRRPLTAAQMEYAAEDVIHLPRMHAILKEKLVELGRYEWVIEDSAALTRIGLYAPDPDSAWQRLKSIPFLPGEQQARARALAGWREQRAVEADKPRGWIASDKALLQMAEQNPQQLAALNNIEDLPQTVIRKQGQRLLSVIATANEAVASGSVSFQQQFTDRDKDRAQVKKCSGVIRSAADKLGIANEVLGSKRDIQALLREQDNARLINGWRRKIVGEEILAAIV
jgi:ribonuclease D